MRLLGPLESAVSVPDGHFACLRSTCFSILSDAGVITTLPAGSGPPDKGQTDFHLRGLLSASNPLRHGPLHSPVYWPHGEKKTTHLCRLVEADTEAGGHDSPAVHRSSFSGREKKEGSREDCPEVTAWLKAVKEAKEQEQHPLPAGRAQPEDVELWLEHVSQVKKQIANLQEMLYGQAGEGIFTAETSVESVGEFSLCALVIFQLLAGVWGISDIVSREESAANREEEKRRRAFL